MTATVTRPMTTARPTPRRVQVTPYTAERSVIGTPAQVACTVDLIRRSGRLVAATRPRQMPDGDRRIYVNVRFLVTPVRPARQVAADRRRTVLRTVGRVAAVAVPVTGVVVALAYAVAWLVAELVRLLPYVGGALVVVLIVWAVLGRAGVCAGLHCPGCSHGGRR
jgi:hypothetical protein